MVLQVDLRVHLSDLRHDELLLRLLDLLLDPLVVLLGQAGHFFQRGFVAVLLLLVVEAANGLAPVGLVQVEQHFLLELVFSVIYRNRIIVLVETVSNCDESWLLDKPNI